MIPTTAPPQAPLPRPTKRERTKYSQSPTTQPAQPQMMHSFDDSTSTSCYPNLSFGQAPPPPVPAQNSSFTEIASYPPVPQIMSTGWSFTEKPEEAWWAYQEPAQQPPMAAAASSRQLRRKRSFESRKPTSDNRHPTAAPELMDVDSMRSRRGSSKSTSSTSDSLPMQYAVKEAKVEAPTRTSSRKRREEQTWEEQYRLEILKKQARQKTRDREVKKHARVDPYSSANRDAGAGYHAKGPAYSFSAANEGYGNYF
ncbi:hypothetical protein ABW21_db0208068 [Orbilia brochopaga]|nr:hypothetical protein ABW21_db0208068 [Drechslerella brochopaga]